MKLPSHEKEHPVNRPQRWPLLPFSLLVGTLAGCRRAPTFNILGSFFPSWLICLVSGMILALIVNRIFVRLSLEKEILWPVVVYPCLALLSGCLLWLIFFN
jgi:hypothetical protein